jgi:hypothetical protein
MRDYDARGCTTSSNQGCQALQPEGFLQRRKTSKFFGHPLRTIAGRENDRAPNAVNRSIECTAPGLSSPSAGSWVTRNSLFRKPSENEGSETQQRRCFVSPKMPVLNTVLF